MSDTPYWEIIGLPPDVSAMTDEERAAYYEHLKEGTVPVRRVPIDELRAQYGPNESLDTQPS